MLVGTAYADAPEAAATYTWRIVEVAAADVSAETTRASEIVFQRLRLAGLADFTFKSVSNGTITVTLQGPSAIVGGIDRLLHVRDLLAMYELRPDGRSFDRLELEARRNRDDAIFARQPDGACGPAPTIFWLTAAAPLFGSPHIERVEQVRDHERGTCRLRLELSTEGYERLAERWDERRRNPMVAVMGTVAHGLPLSFGPLEGRWTTSNPVDLRTSQSLFWVLQAGCRMPPLVLQRP